MKLAIFTDISWPSDHTFLEEVYSKRFSFAVDGLKSISRNNDDTVVEFFMPAKKGYTGSSKVFWNNAIVHVLPSHPFVLFQYVLINWALMMHLFSGSFRGVDLFYVRNDPIIGLLVRFVSWFKFKKMVFQLSHLKSEETMYIGLLGHYSLGGLKGFLSRIFSFSFGFVSFFLTDLCLRLSNLVLPISDAMKDILASRFIRRSKQFVLPLGVSFDSSLDVDVIMKDEELFKFRETLGISREATVLVYLGTLIRTRRPEFMLEILRELVLVQKQNVHLLVVGDGISSDDISRLEVIASDLEVNHLVTFTGRVAREEVPTYLAVSDIGLSVFYPVWYLRLNSPIKLMEYLRAHLPVVGNYNLEQIRMLHESGAGFSVEYDVSDYCRALIKLIDSESLRNTMGTLGSEYILKKRNYDLLTKSIFEKLSSLS